MTVETSVRQGEHDIAPCSRAAAEAHVLRCYRGLLQREPGAEEREHWVRVMLDGLSPDAVTAAFLRGEEYRGLQRNAEITARIRASGLFDAAWYLTRHADVAAAGVDPFAHYCRFGRREQRAPNAYFSPRWYSDRVGLGPDADPLLHYAERGEAAGLPPGPEFDPTWYAEAYRLKPGISPLAHFLQHRRQGFAPSRRLWAVALRPVPSGTDDPFLEWLVPGDPFAAAAPDVAALRPAGVFDDNYYQIINNDVFESGRDALVHFCAFGWREGRNPSFYFNTAWYLSTNPEAARLGINPLVHYLLLGEAAGRRPVAWFDPEWYRIAYALPAGTSALGHYLAHRHEGTYAPNALFDPAWYRAHCGQRLHHRRDLFAHYLVAGMQADLSPSARFDAAAWRAQSRGRRSRHFRHALTPERDNPLVDFMLRHYR